MWKKNSYDKEWGCPGGNPLGLQLFGTEPPPPDTGPEVIPPNRPCFSEKVRDDIISQVCRMLPGVLSEIDLAHVCCNCLSV